MEFTMQESADPPAVIPIENADQSELPFKELDDEFRKLHDKSLEFRTFVENVLSDDWCRESLTAVGDQDMQVLLLRTYESRGTVVPAVFIPMILKQLADSDDQDFQHAA